MCLLQVTQASFGMPGHREQHQCHKASSGNSCGTALNPIVVNAGSAAVVFSGETKANPEGLHMFKLHQMILRQANMVGFVVIVMLLGGVRPVSASDLMFRASFDDGSVEADVAGGDHTPVPGSEREPTTVSGIAGKAVELRAPERSLAYRAPGNIDLNQGSLIIWLKPVDWDRDTEGFLPLLSIGAEKGYAIHYYLYYHHFPDGSRNIDFRARHEGRELCITEREVVAKNPSVLARDEWTQLGLTWSGNQFALFVNGHQVGEQTYGLPITRQLRRQRTRYGLCPIRFGEKSPVRCAPLI